MEDVPDGFLDDEVEEEIPQPQRRITALDVFKREKKHAQEFAKLRKKVEFWHFEPEADKIFPLQEGEAQAIPRPSSAIRYDVGTYQYKISEEDKKRLHEVFKTFDANGSDSIEVKELAHVFRSLDIEPDIEELEMLVREYDEDQSGEIQFDEVGYLCQPCFFSLSIMLCVCVCVCVRARVCEADIFTSVETV
jgi:hypothetical protein